MATAASINLDIANEVRIDHDNVRDLYIRFRSHPGEKEKVALVNSIVREITVHGEVEELTVDKAMRAKGMIVESEKDQKDHQRTLTLIATIACLQPTSPTYDSLVKEAVEVFLYHAKEEEGIHISMLVKQLSEEENTRLTHDFLKARTKVPTSPHPSQPHTGGFSQKASHAVEKAGDAIVKPFVGKKEFARLAFEHTEVGIHHGRW